MNIHFGINLSLICLKEYRQCHILNTFEGNLSLCLIKYKTMNMWGSKLYLCLFLTFTLNGSFALLKSDLPTLTEPTGTKKFNTLLQDILQMQ